MSPSAINSMNLDLGDKQTQHELKDETRPQELMPSPSSLVIDLTTLENKAVETDLTDLNTRYS